MATPVPKNVAAAIGLVPTVLGGVRRLPSKAVQLPVIAVGTALNHLEAAKREYGELADRGEKLIARLRGTSFDEVEDKVENSLSGTPVAMLYDRAEDALERVFESSKDNAKQAVDAGADRAKDRAEANAAVQETVQQALPVEEPAKAASNGHVDSAATPDVVAQVEKITANVLGHLDIEDQELPLPDYDGMTLGALRGRLRSLDMQQLVVLRDYEKSKAHRLPVITMLDNRIAKLANGESAPTGSTPDTPSPKASTATKPPKKVGATDEPKNDPSPPHTKVRMT